MRRASAPAQLVEWAPAPAQLRAINRVSTSHLEPVLAFSQEAKPLVIENLGALKQPGSLPVGPYPGTHVHHAHQRPEGIAGQPSTQLVRCLSLL